MAESFHTRWLRWKFNWFPPYRGSGARITYIDETMREVRVRLPLNWRTRNLNGTIYGGSIYAAVDPIHAVMLASLLGANDYVAWTKEAHVRFQRQARTDLTARFVLEEAEVEEVREELRREGRVERRYSVELHDAKGKVCATCEILVHLHARRRVEVEEMAVVEAGTLKQNEGGTGEKRMAAAVHAERCFGAGNSPQDDRKK